MKEHSKHNIIVNADDFGGSAVVNEAILALMDMNLCKDATLLVNYESSADAAELAINNKRQDRIGIHFNLTRGLPLTEEMRRNPSFCDNEGLFKYNRDKRMVFLSTSEKRAVYNELSAQVALCRKYGIPITHADSHRHVHEEPGLLKIFIRVLKNEKIPYLRLLGNIINTCVINTIYRKTCNSIISMANLNRTDFFGSTNDYRQSQEKIRPGSISELMVHPGKQKDGQIIDTYTKENLSIELPKILEGNNLISYN